MDLKAKLAEIDQQIEERNAAFKAEIKRLKKARKGIATALDQLTLNV